MNEYFTKVQIKIILLEYHLRCLFFLKCCSRMKSSLLYKDRNFFTGKENKSHFQEDKDMTFVQIWSNCLEANSQEQHRDITDNTITDKSVKISNIVSKSIYLVDS